MVRGMVGRDDARSGRDRFYSGVVGEFGGTPSRRAVGRSWPGGSSNGRRRARPRGSIEELSSGSLRVRVYAGVDVLSGREIYLKQLVPAGPSAREEAEQVRERLLRQVEEGRHPRTNASVLQLVERHLEVSPVEPRSKATLQGYLRKHIAPFLGARPIGNMSADVLDAFYAELRRCRDHCDGSGVLHRVRGGHTCDKRGRAHRRRPLAAWTIRKVHYLLSGAYNDAIRWEWISVNLMLRGRKPAPPSPDQQPPSPEEAAVSVSECWKWDLGPFVWLAMTTGARRRELCALWWRDFRVRHGVLGEHECVAAVCQWTLTIRRAVGQRGDELWETDTKQHQRRDVALDTETVAVLVEHRDQLVKQTTVLGRSIADDHHMFPVTPGDAEPCKPSSMSDRYRCCAKRLGIDTTLKSLRHYSATELITAGVDIRTVAGRLGHAGGGATTLKVYAAWVSAADQHASTVLMNRMPQRPSTVVRAAPSSRLLPTVPDRLPDLPAAGGPVLTHERIARELHARWLAGELAPGSHVKVKALAREYGTSVGTAHSAIATLAALGVVRVRTGCPTEVLNPADRPGACRAQPSDRGLTIHSPTLPWTAQQRTRSPLRRPAMTGVGQRFDLRRRAGKPGHARSHRFTVAPVIAHSVDVPVRPPQQRLHPVRRHLTGPLGQRPAVRPLQPRRQPQQTIPRSRPQLSLNVRGRRARSR